MKLLFLFLFFFLFIIDSKAQINYIPPRVNIDSQVYNRYVSMLLKRYDEQKFLTDPFDKSVFYDQIFICYYYLNSPKDTVFNSLFRAFNFDPISQCDNVFKRTYNFMSVSKGNYYPKEMKLFKCLCDSVWNKLDSSLIDILSIVNDNDKKFRENKDDAPWITGNEKKWQEQNILDLVNQALIHKILKRYGYPDKNKIGLDLLDVPFLVVQHADINFQEEHLEFLIKAVKEGKIRKYLLPNLIDRILMRKNLPQRYGTQLIYNKKNERLELYKVEDLKIIDKLREDFDLDKISTFINNNNAFMYESN